MLRGDRGLWFKHRSTTRLFTVAPVAAREHVEVEVVVVSRVAGAEQHPEDVTAVDERAGEGLEEAPVHRGGSAGELVVTLHAD